MVGWHVGCTLLQWLYFRCQVDENMQHDEKYFKEHGMPEFKDLTIDIALKCEGKM